MGCYSNDYHGDDQLDVVLPVGFLDPLPPLERELVNAHRSTPINIETTTSNSSTRKQFWKAGDYEPSQALVPHALSSSNFDDGGGMNPSELRSCMSLGYSAKSKMANTIGQYGNGFKTSTMRLGSDVIVFSLCQGKNGSCATRSIGMLSYTFLTSTGKEDIVVPMSYASILYLRLPPGFRIILRGKDVLHHNLKDDMIHRKELTYRPVLLTTEGTEKDLNPSTDPFWRVWNAAGSDGRGVIGVLEANFVSPAHDKQGFERTTTLQRLEARLIHMQKSYWRDNCHEIGYAPRRSVNKASSTAASPQPIKGSTTKGTSANKTDDNSRRNCVKKFDQVSPFVESSSEEEMTSNGFESPPPINKSRPSHSNIKLDKANNKAAETDKEQEALIQIFAEERERRNNEEDYLRQRLQVAHHFQQAVPVSFFFFLFVCFI
ncbi:hypothetical protein BVRB_6g150260 [Beta vulgaris subsp. vulgaris]|nr:hypothetical protein BVRB_6g150260 [Beta vulgaris subsp. vulgaris]